MRSYFETSCLQSAYTRCFHPETGSTSTPKRRDNFKLCTKRESFADTFVFYLTLPLISATPPTICMPKAFVIQFSYNLLFATLTKVRAARLIFLILSFHRQMNTVSFFFARCAKRVYWRRFGTHCGSHLHWSYKQEQWKKLVVNFSDNMDYTLDVKVLVMLNGCSEWVRGSD